MTRAIDSTTKTSLAANGFRFATLVRVDLASSVYLTDYGVDLTTAVGTFVSSAHLVEVSEVRETGALRVNELTLGLSGVEQTFVAAFLGGEYLDRRVRIWRAVIDASDAVVGAPFLYFDGRISGFTIDDTETGSDLSVSVASHWADFEKVNNRKTNNNSQQLYFPGDRGFEFASKVVRDLRWGRPS